MHFYVYAGKVLLLEDCSNDADTYNHNTNKNYTLADMTYKFELIRRAFSDIVQTNISLDDIDYDSLNQYINDIDRYYRIYTYTGALSINKLTSHTIEYAPLGVESANHTWTEFSKTLFRLSDFI